MCIRDRYNMAQLTLPKETSVLIATNDILETIPKTEFDEFSHHRGATSFLVTFSILIV